jgi:hypothetical protein
LKKFFHFYFGDITVIYSIRVTQEIFVSAPKREVISSQAEINVVIRGDKLGGPDLPVPSNPVEKENPKEPEEPS